VTYPSATKRESTKCRLLAALPIIEYERLLPKFEEVPLNFNSILYARGDTIRHVFFPISGFVSLLSVIDGESTVDVGMVGSEGMIGLSLFLGVSTSIGRAIVQGQGTALRIKAVDFLKECENGGALKTVLMRYTRSVLAQISQSAGCYRFHLIEARLARRLLMMNDRMQTNELQLTQDSLSMMLGVRREAITAAAGSLRKKGLIGCNRGYMTILDRAGLEAAACTCYSIIVDAERL
jgi:CRP-like cAMP-binding protein